MSKNYEEMSNFELSKRAAEILYGAIDVRELIASNLRSSAVWACPIEGLKSFDINNPIDMWPIITENHISIELDEGCWAEAYVLKSYSSGDESDRISYLDENPFRAAIMCFLEMKDNEQ